MKPARPIFCMLIGWGDITGTSKARNDPGKTSDQMSDGSVGRVLSITREHLALTGGSRALSGLNSLQTRGLDDHPVRDHAALGHNDNAIANVVIGMVQFVGLASGGKNDVISNAGIFVHYCIFNAAIAAAPDARLARFLVLDDGLLRLVIVAAQQNGAIEHGARANDATQADNAVTDSGAIDDAPVGNDRVVDLGSINF